MDIFLLIIGIILGFFGGILIAYFQCRALINVKTTELATQYSKIGTLNVETSEDGTNVYLGFEEQPSTLTNGQKVCLEVCVIPQE